MKTTGSNDSPPPKPGATPDRDERKFRHERPAQEEAQTHFGFYGDEEENRKKARAGLRKIKTKTLESLDDKFPDMVVPGLLYQGRRMIVSGKPAEGKGLLLIQLACCVATGEEFLNYQIPRPMKVFVVDFELMEPKLKQRIEGFIKARANNNSEREKELRQLIKENLRTACYLRQRSWLHHPEAFDDIIRRAHNRNYQSKLIILDPGWSVSRTGLVWATLSS